MAKRAALACVLLAGAAIGRASADDVPACARHEDPLAYNACLASHGPKAARGAGPAGRPAPPARDADSRQETRNRAGPARRRDMPVIGRTRGRVHMEFDVR